MVVGSFGKDFVFAVARGKGHSFSDLSREGGARLSSTEIIGRAPLVEFLGPDAETIAFTMQLSTQLGVDPQGEYDKLHGIMDAGEARTLVVGGALVGDPGDMWLIEKLTASYPNRFDNAGKAAWIDLAISLRKYKPRGSAWNSV